MAKDTIVCGSMLSVVSVGAAAGESEGALALDASASVPEEGAAR